MTAKQLAWSAFVLVFFVPTAGYFVVNGYWWLYDGNVPNTDKMMASFVVALFSGYVAGFWADLGHVWRKP